MTGNISLILVRHGNTFESDEIAVQVGLKTDLPLTSKGRTQAVQIAETFKKNNVIPNAIYSGQLKRQVETANIIGEKFETDFILETALNEIDYGIWERQTEAQIKERWLTVYQDWIEAARWPKAIFESSLEVHLAKIKTWLEHLKRNHANQTVIGVTSNGIIRLFLYFSNLNWIDLIKSRSLEQYKVKTGSYCHLTITSNGIIVNDWNKQP